MRLKETIEQLANRFSKDILEDLYLNKLYSMDQIAFELKICRDKVRELINYYNIKRDQYQVLSNKLSALGSKKQSKFEELCKQIPKEDIIKWYIEEDNDYKDAFDHFKITQYAFDKLCKYYGIKKDKSKSRYKGLETAREKYGENNIVNQQKREQTIINQYGSKENFYKQRKLKIEQTNLEKYGFKYKATADLLINHSEEYLNCWHNKEYSIKYLMNYSTKPTIEQLAKNFHCSINSVYLWIEKYNLGSYITITKSNYEQEIINFIESLDCKIDRNNRTILNGQELDVYIPNKKVAIEFNGNYFHDANRIGKLYHFQKSYKCEQLGIRLIHIYQYQWDDPIKQQILKSIITNALGKNTNIIYARKCQIRELKKQDVELFSKQNSLHGHRNTSIYLGLFYNNELVEIMTFGKAYFSKNKNIDYEVIRSITKINTTVVGGMNKLFKYFIKKWNPSKILYYVDYNTHNGNSMEKLGFKFINYSKYGIINIANCKEVKDKYGLIFNRKPEANQQIKEYIKQNKILTIYDAGVKKYIWENN